MIGKRESTTVHRFIIFGYHSSRRTVFEQIKLLFLQVFDCNEVADSVLVH